MEFGVFDHLDRYDGALADYYEDGKEIVVFKSHEDMLDRLRYYLRNDSEREAIAAAGYKRTLRDHTWERRWNDIFSRVESGVN